MDSTEAIVLPNYQQGASSGYDDGLRVHGRHSQREGIEYEHAELPPADHGKDAWLFLTGGFCIEALTWGMYCPLYSTVSSYSALSQLPQTHRDYPKVLLIVWLMAIH